MNHFRTLSISILCFFFSAVLFAQKKPQITVSPGIVLHHGHVELKGAGFTPKSDALSHLRRPDGTEFPVLQLYTNAKGEFSHDIDTVVMAPGVHELWVEDVKTKTTSNIAKFEITMYSKDLK
jgi:hypothetical protein